LSGTLTETPETSRRRLPKTCWGLESKLSVTARAVPAHIPIKFEKLNLDRFAVAYERDSVVRALPLDLRESALDKHIEVERRAAPRG